MAENQKKNELWGFHGVCYSQVRCFFSLWGFNARQHKYCLSHFSHRFCRCISGHVFHKTLWPFSAVPFWCNPVSADLRTSAIIIQKKCLPKTSNFLFSNVNFIEYFDFLAFSSTVCFPVHICWFINSCDFRFWHRKNRLLLSKTFGISSLVLKELSPINKII